MNVPEEVEVVGPDGEICLLKRQSNGRFAFARKAGGGPGQPRKSFPCWKCLRIRHKAIDCTFKTKEDGSPLTVYDANLAAKKRRGGKDVPAKKATKFMSNTHFLIKELSQCCDHTHTHQALVPGRARAAT